MKSYDKLTVREKLKLISGEDCWHTNSLDGALERVRVTDASMGVRMPVNSAGWDGDKPSVSYPSSQVLANTWDMEIVRKYAECVADDCLDAGADIVLGPGVNIKRSPMCGRNFEYYSEDPFLAGTIAKNYISAMQAEGAGACVKHFCANNLEINRMNQSSEVDERTLRELYYEPFRIAMQAKPVSCMSSYNRINGVYGSEYKKGYDVLRNEYGFDGMIMSDWDAVRDRAKAAKAGCDLEMPFSEKNFNKLVKDFEEGKISEEELDACAKRVYDFVVKCKALHRPERKHTLEERIAFTQEVSEAGIVLLKNDGILPLEKGASVAICGRYAQAGDKPELLVGGGSGCVKRLTPSPDMVELMRRVHGGKVMFETAYDDGGTENWMCMGTAVDNAAECDVNIVFAGTGSRIETEGSDRRSMELSPAQVKIIHDTALVNDNTVVVLFAGAPVDMSEWIDEVAAVVYAGFPGERGGEAVINVLTGKVNPSGKLTETFPLSYSDCPVAGNYCDCKVTRYSEGLDVGYRYYDTYGEEVLFPFGHGLSYSQFVYGNLKLVKDGGGLAVEYDVTNASQVDGSEISQVYVRMCSSYVYRPYKELKGFSKDKIKAGQTKRVKVNLGDRAFMYWSTAKDCWDIEDGFYDIIVAASCEDEKLSARIRIKDGEITVL